MVCRLNCSGPTAPNRYMNQSWNIVNSTLGNKLQWNLKRNSRIFIQENAFENVHWEMATILSQSRCDNALSDQNASTPPTFQLTQGINIPAKNSAPIGPIVDAENTWLIYKQRIYDRHISVTPVVYNILYDTQKINVENTELRTYVFLISKIIIVAHYIDVIMTKVASQITSLTVVYSIVSSDADQRKHQSSASLAIARGIHRDRWFPRTKGQ